MTIGCNFCGGIGIFIEFLTWSLSTGVEGDRLIVINSSFVFISDLYVSATPAAHPADDYLRSYSSIKVGFAAASHTHTCKSYVGLSLHTHHVGLSYS